MILRQQTIDHYGYDPYDLAPLSKRKVLSLCDSCGEIQEKSYCETRSRCVPCFKAKRYAPPPQPTATELRMVHGTPVCVKIYKAGMSALYEEEVAWGNFTGLLPSYCR